MYDQKMNDDTIKKTLCNNKNQKLVFNSKKRRCATI